MSAFVTDLLTQLSAAANTASERGYTQVRVFAQDETRLGLLPIVRHRITARGVNRSSIPSIALRVFTSMVRWNPLPERASFWSCPTSIPIPFRSLSMSLPKLSLKVSIFSCSTMGLSTKPKLSNWLLTLWRFSSPLMPPELNPIERLWRDIKDQLARYSPQTLDELSDLAAQSINRYSTDDIRSLTAFPYFIQAVYSANV